jgi:hypothetical protein
MGSKQGWLGCLWCKSIYNAITFNVLIAMLGGTLFFLSDLAAGDMIAYSVSKGLSSVIFLYALASAIVLKNEAVKGYYKK